MKVTWLTQAGLYFKSDKISVIVDPYLSNSVGEIDPKKDRRIPADESYLDVEPDVILITHAHLDHLDPKTLSHYLAEGRRCVTVLAPRLAYEQLCKLGGGHNYVLLEPHSVWSVNGVTFYSVRAAHSDASAAGFIIDDGEKTFYVSGDTVYNFDVIDDVLDLVESGVDYAFLPINGVGNNMHARDAADFAYEIGAHTAIPVHYGLFDSIDPSDFDFEDSLILKPYVEEEL